MPLMLRLLALLLLLLSARTEAAVTLTELYQARVVVTSQASAEREQALRQGLQQALLRISGDDQLLQHALVQQALSQVRDYVVQFGYDQRNDERGGLLLRVQFDREKVNQLIQAAGSGVWSNLRPELLLWLVYEDAQLQRRIVGSGSSLPWLTDLRSVAEQRGLPLKLPLMDLNDSISVSPIDVWGRFDDVLQFASARYPNDGLVVARLYQADPVELIGNIEEPWRLDWSLQLGELRWRGELRGASAEQLAPLLVAELSQQLAQRYRIGQQLELGHVWQMTVHDVANITAVITVEQLLASLPSVQSVQLVGYQQGQAVYQLTLQVDPAAIVQAIDLSKRLRPLEQAQHYRWVEP